MVFQRLTACSLPKAILHPPRSTTSVALLAPEPMQVDSNHLMHAERQWRIVNNLCLYCEEEACIITACTIRNSTLITNYCNIS